MSPIANRPQTLEIPERLRRELRKGESVYHSTAPCHVSRKFPNGKWIGQSEQTINDKLVRLPVKGFGTAKEAVEYVKSLRPNSAGQINISLPGEDTVSDLYEYVTKNRQRRIAEQTKTAKLYRWETYIKPIWGDVPISRVKTRAAQEWITELEEACEKGEQGAPPLSQIIKIRTDLIAIFQGMRSFSEIYEDRQNPFDGLTFTPLPPRKKVTIESQHFPAIQFACLRLAELGLVKQWIVEMYLTSLLAGLREGEVMAFCTDQLDFQNGAFLIDRAMRKQSRALDPSTRLEIGEVRNQAMNYPKGGSSTRDKSRLVPMSAPLKAILEKAMQQKPAQVGEWDLIWPSATGEIRDQSHFKSAWKTLRQRLDEIAKLAPIKQPQVWPDIPKRRGWKRNPLIELARSDTRFRLPDIFGEMDFRDTRNSFASHMNEVGISQASREEFLGHGGKGITNAVYTTVTTNAFQDAILRLSNAWTAIELDEQSLEKSA